MLVDEILADNENAGHVIGPVVACLKENPAIARHFCLRGKWLAHRDRVNCASRECSRYIGGSHLDHMNLVRLDSPYLHRAKEEQSLVREAAWNGHGTAAHVCEGLDGAVFAHHYRAAIAMAKVDNLDGNSL